MATKRSQHEQDQWVINTLNSKRNGFFIEAGALDGITNSNSYVLEKDYGWNGICVEPHFGSYQKLRANRSCICLNQCLDSECKTVDFIEVAWCPGRSGILANDTDNKTVNTSNDVVRRTTTTNLAAILRKYNAPAVIDYLSLDVEGAETRILRHFPFDDYVFSCMTIERVTDELHNILTQNGYVLVKTIPNRHGDILDSYYVHQTLQGNL